ncbi:hypothetical protein WDU94_011109 [Cyamophila willieti]
MKLIKKCDVQLINYYAYQNELVILDPLIDSMVLESKPTSVSHHHHHLHHHHHGSSPHDYGTLAEEVQGSDPCPPDPKFTPHHVPTPDPPPLAALLRGSAANQPSPPPPATLNSVGTMTSNQGLNDLYQRTPLLGGSNTHNGSDWSEPNSNGGTKIIFTSQDDEKKKRGGSGGVNNSNGGVVSIELGTTERGDHHPRYPEEKCKTFIAFLILFFNLLLTTASLAIVHEWVPDRKIYKPLPDIFLDRVPATDWTLDVSEVLIMISTNVMVVVILLHRHRFIILRRLFLMLGLLYMMRSVTMFVTVLPMSSRTYTCAEKANSTSPALIAKRVIQLFSGFGLSINGKHTYCGDYIYSGHTTILAMSYMMIQEYSPKRFFLLHWGAFATGVVGVIMVLTAHGHYTVDVLIAYYITTRLFWTYHTLANNSSLKQRTPHNYLANLWWFPIFQYFEGNVSGPLPHQYESPLQILRRYTSRRQLARDS